MLHVTRNAHVGMEWHALCTRHHVESGVNAWLGSTLCLVFNGGLSILDYIQWSLMGAFQRFFNKTVYRVLSNVF